VPPQYLGEEEQSSNLQLQVGGAAEQRLQEVGLHLLGAGTIPRIQGQGKQNQPTSEAGSHPESKKNEPEETYSAEEKTGNLHVASSHIQDSVASKEDSNLLETPQK
jgi:hypothetical protein